MPFCQVHCPLQNNIPDWLMLTAAGRLREAYELSQSTNNFPEICGRICPHDRLCEGNCVIERAGHGTVTIGSVETYLTETAWREGWVKPVSPAVERAESVGIIGAGPAGLAAAEQLRRKGYQVHVYDRYDRIGGLLVYGIPNFKLEKDVVARRADLLRQSGETLAGRVAVVELRPLDILEVGHKRALPLWLRGGFPDSLLADSEADSLRWRRDFIRSYLERDVPLFGPRIPAETMRRFWVMLAHRQGSLFNAAELARSLDVDGKTVARYLDLLVDLLLVRRLPPLHRNAGKRLDFLAQELNREANTLGSKSMDKDMTQIAIELKVLIEQIREQVQNIE